MSGNSFPMEPSAPSVCSKWDRHSFPAAAVADIPVVVTSDDGAAFNRGATRSTSFRQAVASTVGSNTPKVTVAAKVAICCYAHKDQLGRVPSVHTYVSVFAVLSRRRT